MITWSSRKQGSVALSSIEAEYIVVTTFVAQALWLKKVLEEISKKQSGPTVIFYDNMSVIQLTKNHVHHSRSKNFNMAYHFIRDMVEKKKVELRYS